MATIQNGNVVGTGSIVPTGGTPGTVLPAAPALQTNAALSSSTDVYGNPTKQNGNYQGSTNVNGVATPITNTGATTSPVKLTANTSNAGASTTQTVPAPVVVNSQAATSYLGNVGQQVGNLQQNQQSQAAATAPVAPAGNTGNGTGNASQTTTPTTTTSTTTPTPPANPSDQIQAILDQLTQTENGANANANPNEPKSIYTAQEAQAIWGGNTVGLTQNADGTFTASPEALSAAGITDNNGNTVQTNVNGVPTSETLGQEANDVQTQLANGYAKMNSDLTAIQNGTYPLTPSESSMISSSQEQMLQALQMQATANQSYEGQVGASLASTGGMMGAQQMSLMQGAIAVAAQRTADLNSRMTQSIANLQDSFMKEDYTNVMDLWNATSKYFDDRATAISDMQKTIATQVQNLITNARDQANTQITAIMDSANFGQKTYEDAYTQTQDAIKNALAQGTLDEKTANDLQSRAIAMIQAEKGTYEVKTNPDGTQSIFNTTTGQIEGSSASGNASTSDNVAASGNFSVTPDNINTGFPAVDAGIAFSQYNVPYIDTSKMSSAEKLQAAEASKTFASQNGYELPMLTAANVTKMQAFDNAALNFNALSDLITGNKLDSANFMTRPFKDVSNAVGQSTQMNSQLAGLSAFAPMAITMARTLGAQGRINMQELNLAMKGMPTPDDTVATVQAKINNWNTILKDGEESIVGTKAFEAANPSPASSAINNFLSSNSGTSASGSTPAVNPAFTQLDAQFGLQ